MSDSVVALHFATPEGRTSSAGIATAVSTALGVHFALDQERPAPPKDTAISNCRGTLLGDFRRPRVQTRLCDLDGLFPKMRYISSFLGSALFVFFAKDICAQ